MTKAAAGLALVAGFIASQSPDSIEMLLRYAVEFGGAFGGCVVAIIPFIWPILKRLQKVEDRLERVDNSQAALHYRLDGDGIKMSPGRTLGQPQRTRSGRFRALPTPPASPADAAAPPANPDGKKEP